jgi:hypothetical protein
MQNYIVEVSVTGIRYSKLYLAVLKKYDNIYIFYVP